MKKMLVIILGYLGCQMSISGCYPDPQSMIYVALQTNSDKNATLAEDFLYSLSRKAKRQFFVIDQLKQDKTDNLYSNRANRRAIQAIKVDPDIKTKIVEITPSNDQALIQSFQRINDLTDSANAQPIYVYLVTSGTREIETLKHIKYLCQKIADKPYHSNVYVYLIGLSPENRLLTATALSPIKGNVKTAGNSYEEWNQFLDNI